MTISEKARELRQFILDKRDEGEVVVMGLEGPMSTSLENIIQQPIDGLLYDLNRLEETTLTFIDDPKWVNDFAVALVIRKLKSKVEQLEAENEALVTAIAEVRKSDEERNYAYGMVDWSAVEALGGE